MSEGSGRIMEPERRFASNILVAAISLCCIFGCAPHPEIVSPSPPPLSAFPPQKVMESGDYAGFLAENQQALQECSSKNYCDVALFNLGFVHSYPKSPYYNQVKGLRYFDELVKKYPQSPWAFQATAWMNIIKKSAASEDKTRRLQSETKAKDASINELKEQIKRSREVDLKIEQRERELIK
jgi:hypothetical protein